MIEKSGSEANKFTTSNTLPAKQSGISSSQPPNKFSTVFNGKQTSSSVLENTNSSNVIVGGGGAGNATISSGKIGGNKDYMH